MAGSIYADARRIRDWRPDIELLQHIGRVSHMAHSLAVPASTGLLALTLLIPLLLVIRDGISLTSFQEESIGYRYFYSLRLLYGDADRPWLPQGQAVGLVHMALQLALTALGHPPAELFPRINLFGYIGSAAPLLATGAAFFWTQRTLAGWLPKLALALAVILIFFDRRSGSFDVLTKPDYQAWVGAIAMLTLGCLLRLRQRSESAVLSTRGVMLVAILAGVCVAIKPTYILFPATLALASIRPLRHQIRLALSSVGVALVTFAALTFVYYTGSPEAVLTYVRNAAIFVGSVGNSEPFPGWLGRTLAQTPDVVTLTTLLPVGLALAAFVGKQRIALVCLPGAVLSTWFIFQRFTTATVLDANFFALLAIAACIGAFRVPPIAVMIATGGLAVLAWTSVAHFVSAIYPSYVVSDAREQRWLNLVASVPGTTLFLVPDNEWHFPTVDSAIFKGGTGISLGEGWSSSPLVRDLVPDRWYYRPDATLPSQKQHAPAYTKIAFVSGLGASGVSAAVDRNQQVFDMSLRGLECLSPVQLASDKQGVVCLTPASASRTPTPISVDAQRASDLSARLGVPVIPAEPSQYIIREPRDSIDIQRVGTVRTDVGYAIGLTLPDGQQIGFRFEPRSDLNQAESVPRELELSALLGVPVIPAEPNQYIIHEPRSSIDIQRVGMVHTDVGYAVGVTLASGEQIGFRFEPPPEPSTQ